MNKNHFKTALNDPYFIEKYKNEPYAMALLHAFSKLHESGGHFLDLPWFTHTKSAEKRRKHIASIKKAA